MKLFEKDTNSKFLTFCSPKKKFVVDFLLPLHLTLNDISCMTFSNVPLQGKKCGLNKQTDIADTEKLKI